jgi:2-dehydro-3-deoxy-D-arabinonate dehydratase
VTTLVRYAENGGPARLGAVHDDGVAPLPFDSLAAALRVPLAELREAVERAHDQPSVPVGTVRVLAPVDAQEVWAAGVTYLRSRDARLEESGGADVYQRVYAAERPELFFKSNGRRVAASGESVGVRADSGWNLPEPEVAMVGNAHGEIAGWTVGDDVSSRDIEGDNALYIPQAKVYTRSCALGPGIRPAWELPPDPIFEIDLAVRRGGEIVVQESTDTSRMVRGWEELAAWLTRALDFPDGAVLLTGTGIVPGSDFSLREGDEVSITVAGVGTLRNAVARVGTNSPIPRQRAAAHANGRESGSS